MVFQALRQNHRQVSLYYLAAAKTETRDVGGRSYVGQMVFAFEQMQLVNSAHRYKSRRSRLGQKSSSSVPACPLEKRPELNDN